LSSYFGSVFDDEFLTYQVLRLLGWKIGILAGSPIFGRAVSARERRATADALNNGDLDGVLMTEQVGAIGHTLIGACVIFLGSLYSNSIEEQAIGTLDF
jgi:hypothetical protein